jgi:hypothetical protein
MYSARNTGTCTKLTIKKKEWYRNFRNRISKNHQKLLGTSKNLNIPEGCDVEIVHECDWENMTIFLEYTFMQHKTFPHSFKYYEQ